MRRTAYQRADLSMCISALKRMKRLRRNCRIRGAYLVLGWSVPYEIPLNEIDSKEKLLRWLWDLAEKRWMTAERLAFLIATVDEHFGLGIRGSVPSGGAAVPPT